MKCTCSMQSIFYLNDMPMYYDRANCNIENLIEV